MPRSKTMLVPHPATDAAKSMRLILQGSGLPIADQIIAVVGVLAGLTMTHPSIDPLEVVQVVTAGLTDAMKGRKVLTSREKNAKKVAARRAKLKRMKKVINGKKIWKKKRATAEKS